MTHKQIMSEPLQAPEENQGLKWWGMAFFVLGGLLVVMIFAASWAPDSRMTSLRWVPSWAADWADRDPNIRTVVPFIPLAFLLMQGFAWRGLKWPALWSVLLCGVCLGLSELGQVFLPSRNADVADLLCGAAGIAVGLAAAWVWRKRN